MIKFNKDVELEVTTHYDEETDTALTENERFYNGEIVDGDIFNEFEDRVHIQFGDGSVVYGLEKNCFDLVD